MTNRLGVPYQGSKNQIATEIIKKLPSGKRFVDLFAGGCAITHAAIISGKYNEFIVNDLHGMGVRLFRDSIKGLHKGRWKEWINRERFMELRDKDPLIALCWSFGNNQSQYCYGKDIEKKRESQYKAFVENMLENSFSYEECKAFMKSKPMPESCERLQSLEGVLALDRCEALKDKYPITFLFEDYQNISYQEGDVVYCDPPYLSSSEGDGGYRFLKRANISFDFERFYDWLRAVDYPVFVSEYNMPNDFVCVWSKNKQSIFNKDKSGYKVKTEGLFVQERFAQSYTNGNSIQLSLF